MLRQAVVSVQGDQQHSVDVAARGVALEVLRVPAGRNDREDQLEPGRGDLGLCAAQHGQEVGITEQAVFALGDQEGHRSAAPSDQ